MRARALTVALLCASTASAQSVSQQANGEVALNLNGDHNTVIINRGGSPEEQHADARTRLFALGLRGGFEAQSGSAMGAAATLFAGLWVDVAGDADRSFMLRLEGRFAYGGAFGHFVMPDESRASRMPTVSVLDVGAEVAFGVHLRRREAWSVSIDLGFGVGGAIPLDVPRPDAREAFAFPLTVRLRQDRFFLELRPQLAVRPAYDVRYTGFLAETAETTLGASFMLEGGAGVAF